VRRRLEGTENPRLKTGQVEVVLEGFEVLARSEVLPFKVDEHGKANEDLRLRYRFLDLRRPHMQEQPASALSKVCSGRATVPGFDLGSWRSRRPS
jgi:aspartyl-tRNA synthetase